VTWTPLQQTNVTPPSKRPRGRPRKTAVTPPVIAQLAVKPSHDSHQQTQPVPSSILSPPASVSSASQPNLVHRNSTSPSTHVRYINDNVLTPSSTTDTNVIARVPSLFEQVKTTTNESTFAVLSGVQNVLLSPNRDTNNNNNNNNNNTGRYHHHTPPDMDVVTAAAIGAAAAAQMFHHEKQSHHGYTPTSHHFDYHLGGSMMATASYGFPTQSNEFLLFYYFYRSYFFRF
jgi:hypothetical protein